MLQGYPFRLGWRHCIDTTSRARRSSSNVSSTVTMRSDGRVPDNNAFSVETIDGNIIIEGQTTQVKAHSISGFIDMAFAGSRKADLKMSTISGTIYSDIVLDKGSSKHKAGNDTDCDVVYPAFQLYCDPANAPKPVPKPRNAQ